MKVDSAQETAP